MECKQVPQNITGVYDIGGGANEHTAAYVNNGSSNLTTYGASIVQKINIKDVYKWEIVIQNVNYEANKTKVEFTVYEGTSSQGTGNAHGIVITHTCRTRPIRSFFMRQIGVAVNGAIAGVFCFTTLPSNS